MLIKVLSNVDEGVFQRLASVFSNVWQKILPTLSIDVDKEFACICGR